MRIAWYTALLLGAAAAQDAPQPAETPAAPARHEASAARASEAVKRVMAARMIRLKEERRRLTPENSAACAELAERLNAPAELVQLLRREAAAPLSGRALHDHNAALTRVVQESGVDALQIRLFVEGLECSAAEQRALIEWLPLKAVFNLIDFREPDTDELDAGVQRLAAMYDKLTLRYAAVTNRAQADAAAQELLGLLEEADALSLVVLLVQEDRSARLRVQADRYIAPARSRLSVQRRRLRESAYFGSSRLAALDYLMG